MKAAGAAASAALDFHGDATSRWKGLPIQKYAARWSRVLPIHNPAETDVAPLIRRVLGSCT